MTPSLNVKQSRLVGLHASGMSNSEAARELGVSRQTIISWLKLPHVQSAVEEAQQTQSDIAAKNQAEFYQNIVEVVQTTRLSSCRDYLPDAIETIATILRDPESRNSDRLRAAELIFRWVELANPSQPKTLDSAVDPSKLTEEEIHNELSRIAALRIA